MSTLLQKLSSRKLWMAILGAVAGIAIAVGASSDDVSTVVNGAVTIVGCLTTLASIVTYIKTEGAIDAANIQTAVSTIETAVETAKTVVDTVTTESKTTDS